MKSRKFIKLVVGSLTGGALILSGLALQNVVTPTASQNQTDTVQAQGSASEFEETIMKAVEKAKDSVVSIQTTRKKANKIIYMAMARVVKTKWTWKTQVPPKN